MLTQESLYALWQVEEDLRNSNVSMLYYNVNSNTETVNKGIYSLADAVNELLIMQSANTIDLSAQPIYR